MLVGRKRELELLEAALGRVAEGEGEVWLVAGEAGVGKSHLLAALIERGRARGLEVVKGRCFADTAASPFAPWREAFGDPAVLGKKTRHALAPLEARARAFETSRWWSCTRWGRSGSSSSRRARIWRRRW